MKNKTPKNLKDINKKKISVAKIRHSRVLEKILKGKKKGEAMKEEGYSDSYANSGVVDRTKSWNEHLKTTFSDEVLAKVHTELLLSQTVKVFEFSDKISEKEAKELCENAGFKVFRSGYAFGKRYISAFVPDKEYRDRALDKAYKLKKRYVEPVELSVNKFREMPDSELAKFISGKKKFFTKKE